MSVIKRYNFLAVLFFAAFVHTALAQELKPGQPNELDNKFTPVNSALFSDGNSGGRSYTGARTYDFKSEIKVNLFLLARSIINVGYERQIADQVSVQGAAGLCVNKDYIFIFSSSEELNYFWNTKGTSSIPLIKMLESGEHKSGGNLFIGGGIKLLFSGYGTRTGYIQLGIRHYGNKLELPRDYTYGYSDISGDNVVHLKQTNYMLQWGFRGIAGGKMSTTHEAYIGIGFRNLSYDPFEKREEFTVNGPVIQHHKLSTRETISMPMLTCGYILGIGF